MKLKDYVDGRGMKLSWLARQIDVNQAHLHQIKIGKVQPKIDIIHKIHLFTKGEVTYEDWLKEPPKNKKAKQKKS